MHRITAVLAAAATTVCLAACVPLPTIEEPDVPCGAIASQPMCTPPTPPVPPGPPVIALDAATYELVDVWTPSPHDGPRLLDDDARHELALLLDAHDVVADVDETGGCEDAATVTIRWTFDDVESVLAVDSCSTSELAVDAFELVDQWETRDLPPAP